MGDGGGFVRNRGGSVKAGGIEGGILADPDESALAFRGGGEGQTVVDLLVGKGFLFVLRRQSGGGWDDPDLEQAAGFGRQ